VSEIIKSGFDLRVSNLNGALGAGIYFASRAGYSNDYAARPAHSAEDQLAGRSAYVPPPPPLARGKRQHGASHPRAGGERTMLSCRVVEGKSGPGAQMQRRPREGCHSCAMADPVSASAGGPHRIMCVFDNWQCYPE
jgi:hypothetical protein